MTSSVHDLERKFAALLSLISDSLKVSASSKQELMTQIKDCSRKIDAAIQTLPQCLPLNVPVELMLNDVGNQKHLVETYIKMLEEKFKAIEDAKAKNFNLLKEISNDYLLK